MENLLELILDCGNYGLKNSFSPSFISSLYESREPNTWIKIAGYLGGRLRIEQRGKRLTVTSTIEIPRSELEELVILETGLWHDEFEHGVKTLPSKFRQIAEALAEAYPGVRIPIAPRDFNYILIAILLSKRANYEIVKRWCREIWRNFDCDFQKMILAKPSKLRKITRSYQLADAVKSIRDLVTVVSEPGKLHQEALRRFGRPKGLLSTYILSLPPEVARLILASIWGIGGKVADSIILSTFKASSFIPCDAHLKRFVTKLSLVEDFKMPEKSLCRKFLCKSEGAWGLRRCPSTKCLRALLRFLGDLGGWIQTLIYLHGKDYCRPIRPRCGECPVKGFCINQAYR